MAEFMMFIVPLGIVFVPLLIRSFVKNAVRKSTGNQINRNRNTGASKPKTGTQWNRNTDSYKEENKISKSNSRMKTTCLAMDDRANDWLAKQMREERKSKIIVSEMFQLKMQHRNACEAEFIKRFHESQCDASGIDMVSK